MSTLGTSHANGLSREHQQLLPQCCSTGVKYHFTAHCASSLQARPRGVGHKAGHRPLASISTCRPPKHCPCSCISTTVVTRGKGTWEISNRSQGMLSILAASQGVLRHYCTAPVSANTLWDQLECPISKCSINMLHVLPEDGKLIKKRKKGQAP